ncbi:HD domain-containing protein [Desulfitobacterium hafniense]|uniref:GTP pyrophosphokinase n=3 Tax=Desulfitobacterium hafniense TaxID=49338 RepID=Q24ZR8_DESHY|nr:HD domain-containing protein [Desulfitobacterium hafniense]EHL06276.1 hypothetical protein HMPREF0322_03028 [Desulfitobacterium hafniense DP7]KTE91811.1 GTP pyrophosphokinase [Desulfitobacterium hafniense]BAE82474.1 hypothetical protein DSY0685 [Desulfitobacterium hafniense Y51]
MLNKAIKIAVEAHAGQVDKGGEPYILHPLRVMLSPLLTGETERICAVLHDVVEDSQYTFADLRKAGFSEETVRVLDFLTRREGESYDEFISRVMRNKTACQIRTADLLDNTNLKRIKAPTEEDMLRIKKYEKALWRIHILLSI